MMAHDIGPLRCFEADTTDQGFASTARRPIACGR
jgi:hypothetical protein